MPTDQRFEDLNPDPNAQPAESLDRAGEHVNATGQCRNNDGSDPQILDGKERDCSPATESGASPVDGPIEGGININEVHGGNIHEEPGDGSNLPFGSNNALYGDGNADMIGNVNGSDDGNKSDESVDGTGDGDNSENGNLDWGKR